MVVAAWLGALLFAGAALIAQWLAQRRVATVSHWPRVEGKVIGADLEQRSNGTFAPQVSYAYVVDGKPQASDRLRPGGIPFFYSEGKAIAVLAPYRVGEAVTVFHHPTKPGHAAIELLPLSHARLVWLALTIAMTGVALLLTFT